MDHYLRRTLLTQKWACYRISERDSIANHASRLVTCRKGDHSLHENQVLPAQVASHHLQYASNDCYYVAEDTSSYARLGIDCDQDTSEDPDTFASTSRHADERSVSLAEAKIADDLRAKVRYTSIADVGTGRAVSY